MRKNRLLKVTNRHIKNLERLYMQQRNKRLDVGEKKQLTYQLNKAANNVIFGVDYDEPEDSYFMLNYSFNVLDWIITDRICSQKSIKKVNKIVEREQAIQLCFNIFPQQISALHKLIDTPIDYSKYIMELFDLCANAGESFESYQNGLQIPFFKNH